MNIKTLEHISEEEIVEVFNHSFSDYLIPIHLSQEQLATKIKAENIKLNLSLGTFDRDRLVGFILHGLDSNQGIVYNGGTGVIPDYRGSGLTRQMYAFILPQLKKEKIKQLVLEVIANNVPAIKSYEKIGYQNVRDLYCYKGTINLTTTSTSYDIKELNSYDWSEMIAFWDTTPAWQYSQQSIDRSMSSHSIFAAFIENEMIGYAAMNMKSHRISQLAVSKEHRRQGVGTSLIQYICVDDSKSLSMINVDHNNTALHLFLEHCGLHHFLTQHEMKLNLNDS